MTLPALLPCVSGQTVLSLVENDARFTGRPLSVHLAHLTSRRGPLCSSTMPCGGYALREVFAGVYGPERLLVIAHSAVPLCTLSMSDEQAEQVVNQYTSGCLHRKSCSSLGIGLQCGNRSDIQCLECAHEALRTYGFTVGLVSHKAAFVTRCANHECSLKCDGDRSRLEELLNSVNTPDARRNSLSYSRCVHDLLLAGPHRQLGPVIVHELTAKGFITTQGHWRVELLRRAFKAFYSGGFTDARQDWMVKHFDVVETCIRAAARKRPIHYTLLILLHQMATQVGQVANPRTVRVESANSPEPEQRVLQEYRAAWLSHLAANAGLTRTQLRHKLAATWAWLYRHDRAWLESNQVAPTKPAGGRLPSELPEPLLDAIRRNTMDLRYSADGREPLPSGYQRRLGVGMTEYAFDRVTRSLNGGESNYQLPASKQIFVTRRVARAAADLAWSGTQALSVIARAARLRPETLINFYPQPI